MMARRFPILLCLVALAGCSNLGAVQDISARLGSASASWNDVSAEIAQSCERERPINPALVDCELEHRASEGLIGANAVLAAYFDALGSAAGASSFTIEPGLNDLAGSAANIPGISEGQVQAVSGLLGLLARAVTERMRENTLRELIREGAPPAQTVIRGLDELVVPRLANRLETEQFQLTDKFVELIQREGDDVRDPETLCSGSAASRLSATGFLLALEYCRRLEVTEQRRQALADYRRSLAEANQALAELQSARADLKSKATSGRLLTIGAKLEESVGAVSKAFG